MSNEADTLYTKEEVIAYATWATSAMLSKSSIESTDKNNVLVEFEKVVSGLVKYDTDKRNAVSVLDDIKSKLDSGTQPPKSNGLMNHKCEKLRS